MVEEKQKNKIGVIMSMPRLCESDNVDCVYKAFAPFGVEVNRGTGVFWSHVLTNMIEKQLENGADYLFIIDYDTWFLPDHVEYLCKLIQQHPEADVLVPMQLQREGDLCLMGFRNQDGKPLTEIQHAEKFFEPELVKIGTGHFGLTLFRMSLFEKLKKPWFLAVPGTEGNWKDDHIDEDIYFWNNLKESGFKAFLATKCFIGHLQLLCSFPETLENQFRPRHVYMNDVKTGKYPKHILPWKH